MNKLLKIAKTTKRKNKKKHLGNIIYWLVVSFLAIIAALVIVSTSDNLGKIKLFVVQSGSMTPALPVGSVILVKPADSYYPGDIVTFRNNQDLSGRQPVITHRIISVNYKNEGSEYFTKGDQNSNLDTDPVGIAQILGKLFICIPLLGFPISFAKTLPGLIILIVIPVTIVVYSQLLMIGKQIRLAVTQRKKTKKPPRIRKQKILSGRINMLAGLLIVNLLAINFAKVTNAYFSNLESIAGSSISSGDWEAPTSEALGTSVYNNSLSFDISYQASDNLSNIAEVRLYYDYNYSNIWTYYSVVSPASNPAGGVFHFVSQQDGHYRFVTIAADSAGNIEDDINENGILEPDELNILPADVSTTVDTQPPVTMLSVETPTVVANDAIYNGGFENGNLDGWVVDSADGDHQVTDKDKKTGSNSLLLGYESQLPVSGIDSIKQAVNLPPQVSTLTFWYRLITNDLASGGFFNALVKYDSQEIKVAHTGWDDPTVDLLDLGWRNVIYQLTGLTGKSIEVQFSVNQLNSNYQTWAYLDDVKVCSSQNQVDMNTPLTLVNNDGSGSDNSTITYRLNSGPITDYTGPIGVGTSGNYTLSYRATDAAGNIEPEKTIELGIGNTVNFGVVLNEFLPDPSGDDGLPAPDGEWVELYNNGTVSVDANGWTVENSSGQQFVISLLKTEGQGTVITSGGKLRVYRRGSVESDPDFSLNNSLDTVKILTPDKTLVDSFQYSNVVEGKSYKRDPDGLGSWKDPLPTVISPTPSALPKIDAEPTVDFFLSENTKVGFKLENLKEYTSLVYEITYQVDTRQEGISGTVELNGANDYQSNNFILGTCSSGGTCVYHQGVDQIKLFIKLNSPTTEKLLEKVLNLNQ